MAAAIACPTTEMLERLLLGQVTADEASSLETHVAQCTQCHRAVRGIRAEDGLVAAMQEAAAIPPVASAAAEALIPWLKRLRPKDPTRTMVAEPPTSGLALPTYDFLSAPVEADEIGRLGSYRVLQPVGVGGMGIVFLAEDARLKRHVALKLIKPELLQRRDLRERFLSEARAIAAVEHDNIVVIHEADEISGIPYLVMPFLQGESLEDLMQRIDGPLSVDDVLHIGREIAAGLTAAHARGLVHRDVKPSNLWLEERQESGASGKEDTWPQSGVVSGSRIKILDFGLARTVEGVAETNDIIGTPAYMSPEQGRGLPADERSDLFSLGCVMYRMATGRVPFHGKDVGTTLISVATETPTSSRKLNPRVPADLAKLIDKLIAKKAEDRFASAQEVVEAIRQIEFKRQPRTHGRWLALSAACIVFAILGTFIAVRWQHQPPPAVDITFEYDEPNAIILLHGAGGEEEIDIAKSPKQALKPGEYVIRPKTAIPNRTVWPANFVVERDKPMTVPMRLVGLIRTYAGHSQAVNAVAFLPNGSPLALSGSNDFDLRLWDTSKEHVGIRLIGHESPVRCLAISPNGKTALTGSGKAHPRNPDIHARVWDLDSQTVIAELNGHHSSVTAVAFDPEGRFFVSGDKDGLVIFWDAKKLTPIQSIEAHDRSTVYGFAFVPGGKLLSCGADHKLLLWNTAKPNIEKNLGKHTEPITSVSASPDGKHAATASSDGAIRVWDLQSGECLVLRGHEKEVHCVAYSPDGKRLLSAGWDKTVRLWNADSGDLIHSFNGHNKAVLSVAVGSDGRHAISGGADGNVCLWELPK